MAGQKAQGFTAKTRSQSEKKDKGKSKGKGKKYKPSAKRGKVDFDETVQDDPDDQQNPKCGQKEVDEAEVYFADAQTSESEVDIGVMPDWSAIECTDYKSGAVAFVACLCSTDTPEIHSDT